MAAPIEMIKGGERMTVYSEGKAAAAAADGWQRVADLTPEQHAELERREAAPWRNFDEMSIAEIVDRLTGSNDEWRVKVLEYEKATKNRKGLIAALGGVLAAPTEEQPPVTVETVTEKNLETIETVEIVPAEDAPAP